MAPDETVILLHLPLPLVGVSIVMEGERQQNDSLVNGYHRVAELPVPEQLAPGRGRTAARAECSGSKDGRVGGG